MLDDSTRQEIENTIQGNKVVLFMKGNRMQPRCGFSARVVETLNETGVDYVTVDVLSNPHIRAGIKAFSNWPTIPQLYIDKEFVGGCDIVTQMAAQGELHELLGLEFEEVLPPSMVVTPAAVRELKAAGASLKQPVRLVVNAQFRVSLSFDNAKPGDLTVDADGVLFVFDRGSAQRADGVNIDFAVEGASRGFKITGLNTPPPVKNMTVQELKALIDSGETLNLFDVRGEDERRIVSLPGVPMFNDAALQTIMALPKDSRIILHCRSGQRSMQAAQTLAEAGYSEVYNVAGGILAWAREIDTSLPTY